jgi:hypothetical protein
MGNPPRNRTKAHRFIPQSAFIGNGPWGTSKEAAMAGQNGDPRHHTQKMAKHLQDTIAHLREDVKKVDEPQLKAMFETSAEVLGGLVKAFKDYEHKNEAAWRK